MAPAADDFYGVLGLKKECTPQELRNAYKRLALRWHPDRCSGNTRSVDEAKKKFQAIHEAYSVLSDSNKRFLYDVGIYQNDDDDENMQDMGDFLSEMAAMMSQTKPNENGEESLEQLQELFDEMFQDDNLSNSSPFNFNPNSSPSSLYASSFNNYSDNSNPTHKRHSADYANDGPSGFNAKFQNFCFGVSQ
uniref:J domain-containing protein n=1 Tax=Kalanchoe fedtschenkoi TaxID=63787 RepID=A0A7N0RJK6_KALFE